MSCSQHDLSVSTFYPKYCLFLIQIGMETVDHFPIITAILGILVGLVCKPTDKDTKERSVTALVKEPGFQFELLDNVVNSGSELGGASSYNDRKQFSLRNCECYHRFMCEKGKNK